MEKPKVQVIVSNETLSRFMSANKKMEPILKMLLRTSPGIFEAEVVIDEHILATKLRLPKEEFYQQMLFMNNSKIIHYQRRNERPMVRLLQDRQERDALRLDADFIRKRAKAITERIEGVKLYIHQTIQCRSVFIATYFGEVNIQPCGVCDLCLQEKKKESSDLEVAFKQLHATLSAQPKTIAQISDAMNINVSFANQLLDWALIHKQIIKNERGEYSNA